MTPKSFKPVHFLYVETRQNLVIPFPATTKWHSEIRSLYLMLDQIFLNQQDAPSHRFVQLGNIKKNLSTASVDRSNLKKIKNKGGGESSIIRAFTRMNMLS